MNNFRTEIKIDAFKEKLEYDSKVIFLGSCFADNIGGKFLQTKLPVVVNPFGVIYNPMSVANTLYSIIQKRTYHENELRYHNGLWLSLDHHSSFSDNNKDACLQKINHECHKSHDFLNKANLFYHFWHRMGVPIKRDQPHCLKLPQVSS